MRTKLLVIAGLALPTALAAQLPATFNPRSIALGGAYTSLARGWEAALSNPAMLAARGRPGFSLGLPTGMVETGSNTYTFGDFRTYANKTLTDADKAYLLNRITQDDSMLTIRGVAGVAPVGLSIGPVALAAYTTGSVDLSMGADAVELFLYGNAHRSGVGQAFTADNSGGAGWSATTLAASLALPVASLPLGRLSVGATYKHILGHTLGRGGVISSSFVTNPFAVNAAGHAIYTDFGEGANCGDRGFSLSASSDPCSMNAGKGFGVDVGAVLQMGGRNLTLSAVLVNALGSMDWQADRMVYERTTNTMIQDGSGSITDTSISVTLRGAQIDADPVARAYRDSLMAEADFSRVLRVGAALRRGMVTLTAGGSLRLAAGLDGEPAQTLSAGGELRLLGFLPLRAGISSDLGKTIAFSAGSGLSLFGFNLDASIASITGSDRPGVIVGVGASLMW